MLQYKCSIDWTKDGRKRPVPINFKYSATTYVEGVDCTLSITIEIRDDINKGYLTFLRPELVEGIALSNTYLNIMEGARCVGKLHIMPT